MRSLGGTSLMGSSMSWTDKPGLVLPRPTLQTIIGISVAVTGNVLISFALNLQKLAHLRLDLTRQKNQPDEQRENGVTSRNSRTPNPDAAPCFDELQQAVQNGEFETQPLIFRRSSSQPPSTTYGLTQYRVPVNGDDAESRKSSITARSGHHLRGQSFVSRFLPPRLSVGKSSSDSVLARVVVPVEVFPHRNTPTNHHAKSTFQDQIKNGKETDYLRSKLWWTGFVLMNIGETGNFISYAFAPASLVAPLGTFALVANCFFAPLLLNERFRPRDILGILLAIIGATTVVLSTPSSDGPPPVLTPDALVEAVTQRSFVIFSITYLVAAIILGGLSEGSLGRRMVVVDVGLCAIFGGFTVLATKAISTLLAKEWVRIMTEWITYPTVAVLVITGVLQIRYLNRALKRFDSKTVIPTQFVFFALSAVVGSAVLYGDFRRASFHEMVTFLYGCAATFTGVFVIASSPNGNANEPVHDEERRDAGGRRQAASRIDGVGSLVTPSHPVQVPSKVGAREIPGPRHKQSAINLVGYTPVQNILLVHSPSRERVDG